MVMSFIEFQAGNPDNALINAHDALQQFNEMGTRYYSALTHHLITMIHMESGDLLAAEYHACNAARIHSEIEDWLNYVEATILLGDIYEAQENFDAAITTWQIGYERSITTKNPKATQLLERIHKRQK